MTAVETPVTTRPRVEGEREVEIFGAVVDLLIETGYDKLTFDAVASQVHVSKATLYRKWSSKAELVVEAVVSRTCILDEVEVDTGSLRGDLLTGACEEGGLTSVMPALISALLPALQRDPELFEVLRTRFIEPKQVRTRAMFSRAQARDEVGPGADLDRLAMILPALCIHEAVIFGRAVTRDDAVAIIDEVVLPACRVTLD